MAIRDRRHCRDMRALKQQNPIHEVIGRSVPLKRQGSEWMGLCPFHGEKSPSFTVYRDRFHCFGCGADGDVIDFVRLTRGISWHDALAELGAGELAPVDPAELIRREAVHRARLEAEARESIARAALRWRRGRPIVGTLAERYLAGRGLGPAGGGWSPALRFLDRAKLPPDGPWLPVLLAAATRWPDHSPVAVQATALAEPGRKADLKRPRWTVGVLPGAAVRLAPWREGLPVILTEGAEDGLAVALAVPGAAVWAVLGAPNAANVLLPERAEVILALDGDRAGRKAAENAAAELGGRGHRVRIAELPDGQDPAAMVAGAAS